MPTKLSFKFTCKVLKNLTFTYSFSRTTEGCTSAKWGGNQGKKPYRSGDWKANEGLKRRESSGWLWEQMLGFCVGNDGNQTKLEERRSRSWNVKSSHHHAFCHCTTTLNSWTLTGCVPPKQRSKTIRKKDRGYRKTRTPTQVHGEDYSKDNGKAPGQWLCNSMESNQPRQRRTMVTRNNVSKEKSLEWID